MSKLKEKLKKIFCKHSYIHLEKNRRVHYPEHEPAKFVHTLICTKCRKEKYRYTIRKI